MSGLGVRIPLPPLKYYIMKITTKYGTYEERELAQLIRRNMMSRVYKDKTKYTRKVKHKRYD